MILLDSDHLTILMYPESDQYGALTARMDESLDEDFATTVVNLEEQTRGWLSYISREREVREQIVGYVAWPICLTSFTLAVVRLDERAADEFDRLRRQGIRIGTMDLKIASIALVQNATLWTANLRDFQKVPDSESRTGSSSSTMYA